MYHGIIPIVINLLTTYWNINCGHTKRIKKLSTIAMVWNRIYLSTCCWWTYSLMNQLFFKSSKVQEKLHFKIIHVNPLYKSKINLQLRWNLHCMLRLLQILLFQVGLWKRRCLHLHILCIQRNNTLRKIT